MAAPAVLARKPVTVLAMAVGAPMKPRMLHRERNKGCRWSEVFAI